MKQILLLILIGSTIVQCINDNELTDKESAIFVENAKALEDVFEAWNFRINFPNKLDIQIDSTSVSDEVTITTSYSEGHCWLRCFEDKYNYYHSDSLGLIEFNLDYSQRDFVQQNLVTMVQLLPKSLDGYPGREYRFSYDKSGDITTRRIYLVKNRVYEIGNTGPASEVFNQDLTDFFESFTLVNVGPNSIPYLNLPTDEELESPPFEVNFFGETKRKVEIGETIEGEKAPLIIEINEVNNEDGSGLLALSVSYLLFPENNEDLGFDYYLENSLNSAFLLDPSTVILSKEKEENIASYRMTRVFNEQKCIQNIRYIYHNNIYFVISTISLYNSPEDDRIKAFFDSFKIIK